MTLRSILLFAFFFAGFSQLSYSQTTQAKPYSERLREKAEKGDAEAQFELAKNYETGRIGLPKDWTQALRWYRASAAGGDAWAELSLGILYNFGKGVERNYFDAYVWYERAAAHLTEGDRASVVEMRDRVAARLSAKQLQEARQLAASKSH